MFLLKNRGDNILITYCPVCCIIDVIGFSNILCCWVRCDGLNRLLCKIFMFFYDVSFVMYLDKQYS